jgi:hypothetical protein
MKLLITYMLVELLISTVVRAQDKSETKLFCELSVKDELNRFIRLDPLEQPITDKNVEDFCQFVDRNPVVDGNNVASKMGIPIVRTATNLYGEVTDESQKKKILNLMMGMFLQIQAARDTWGVDPLSKTESRLYFDPPLSEAEKQKYKNLGLGDQTQQNDSMSRRNRLTTKIDGLSHLHGYLHRAITYQLKIPLPGISAQLERSPAEKARTKDMLEKQATERGRPAPVPKEQER